MKRAGGNVRERTDQRADAADPHSQTLEPTDASQAPAGAFIRKMSQRYIVGEISAEQAIELAKAHHSRVLDESCPPF
jgi:hypothetical protein